MKTLSRLLLLAVTLLSCAETKTTKEVSATKIYPEITQYIKSCETDFEKIPKERKDKLKKLNLFVKSKLSSEQKVDLLFICTHNSRRSHMAQIWAQIAAEYYDVKGVSCYSGGTEATAFNARAVNALSESGLKIKKLSEDKNSIYEVKFSDTLSAIKAYSKKYSDDPNPKNNFCAVMTCSHADKNCPSIEGCALRLAIPYEDPKISDDSPQEAAIYKERCKQIATEMLYVFSLYSK